MKNNKSNSKKIRNTGNNNAGNKAASGAQTEAEVLYQRLGDRVFAFSMIDDEVYVGSLTAEEITAQSGTKTFKHSGKA